MLLARLARGRAGHGVLLGGQATTTTDLPGWLSPSPLGCATETSGPAQQNALSAPSHALTPARGRPGLSRWRRAPDTRASSRPQWWSLCLAVSVSQQPETLFTQARNVGPAEMMPIIKLVFCAGLLFRGDGDC